MMRKLEVNGHSPETFCVARYLDQVDELLSNSNHSSNNDNNNTISTTPHHLNPHQQHSCRTKSAVADNNHTARSPLVFRLTPCSCKHHHHHHHQQHDALSHQSRQHKRVQQSPRRASAQPCTRTCDLQESAGHTGHMDFEQWLWHQQQEFERLPPAAPEGTYPQPSAMSETEDEQEPHQQHPRHQHQIQEPDADSSSNTGNASVLRDIMHTRVEVSEWDPIRLPCEIILHILKSLDGADIMRLSCTSKSWRAFVLYYQDEIFQRACLKKGWTSLPGSPSNTTPRVRHRLVPGTSSIIDWLYIFRRNMEVEHKWLRGHFNIDVAAARDANVHLPKFTAESWGTMLDANASALPQLQAPANSCTASELEDGGDQDEGCVHCHDGIVSTSITAAGSSSSSGGGSPMRMSRLQNEWREEWTAAAFCDVSF